MSKITKKLLLISAAVIFSALALIGCSGERSAQAYISNQCYVLKEDDFYDFQTKHPTTAAEEEKEEYRIPYQEELTAGESYYVVGYTYAKTKDGSSVSFWDDCGFSIKCDKPINDIIEVTDYGSVRFGNASASVSVGTPENDDGKNMFYNVRSSSTDGVAEFISYLKIEVKGEARLDFEYQTVASGYIGNNDKPVYDRANTVSEAMAMTYFAKKMEIPFITVQYLKSEHYVDGRYNSDNLLNSVDMKAGKVYYMVIVANYLSRIESPDNDTFTLEVKLPISLLDGTLEVAGSGNFSETLSGNEKSIKITVKIPEAAVGEKKLECMIKLIPVALGSPSVSIGFSASMVSILGDCKDGLTETLSIIGEEKTSEGFGYALSGDGTYYILESVGTANGSSFLIPAEYNGKPVKEIAEGAFRNQKTLRTVEVSEGIERIGANAFRGCDSLLIAKLPSTATVGNYAFYDCKLLGSLTANFDGVLLRNLFGGSVDSIPSALKTVTVVGSTELLANAFASVSSVESISLPATLVTVGDGAFSGCSSLTSITLDSASEALLVQCGILYDKATVTPLGWVAKFNGVMSYPEGVTKIPGGDMSAVTNVIVPSSATGFIGSVSNLEPVYVEGPSFVFGYASTTNLTYAKITGEGALPVFTGAEKLETVELPATLEAIPSNAFSGCVSLKKVFVTGSQLKTALTFPSGVTEIGGAAFSGCVLITEIELPSGITAINYDTFKGCTGLKSVKIPSGVTVIGRSAFENCAALASVTMPDAITNMDWYAFKNCVSLTSITIPAGDKYVKPHVFEGCTSLATVSIPNGVEYICEGTFKDCKKLKSVKLPDTVRIIDPQAFAGSGLTEITIPAAVTTLSTTAFDGCTALKAINVDGENTTFYSKNGVVYYTANNTVWVTPEGK